LLYIPEGPYIIKSGKRSGQCLETMITREYGFLKWWKGFLDSKSTGDQKNELHRHLEWLLEQGENRQPKIFCPHCGERPVSLFAVYRDYRGGKAFDFNHAYCRSCFWDKCPPSTIAKKAFLFSFFGGRLNTRERFLAIKLFREVFGLPKRLTRQKTFEFFANPDNRIP